MKYHFLVAFLAFVLCGAKNLCFAAPKPVPAAVPSPRPIAKPALSASAQRALNLFIEHLAPAETAQKSALRALALASGARTIPNPPANALLKWLEERRKEAQTEDEKRAAMQDFLLVARPLLKQTDLNAQRRGLRVALSAQQLALEVGDKNVAADIAEGFLVPALKFADLEGDLGVANLLEALWPRYGRIVDLQLQSEAEIQAMQKKAQTSKVPIPAVNFKTDETGEAFLNLMAELPGPRRDWARYRLARLAKARGNLKLAVSHLEKVSLGNGAGVFRWHLPNWAQEAGVPGFKTPAEPKSAEAPLEGEAAIAWANLKKLLPPFEAAQRDLLKDLRVEAEKIEAEDANKAAVFRDWANELENANVPVSAELKERRKAIEKISSLAGQMGVRLTQAAKVSRFSLLPAIERDFYARTLEAFVLPHWEIGAPASWQQFSRPYAMRRIGAAFQEAGDLSKTMAALEIWTSIERTNSNAYGQALDLGGALLARNARLEDAILLIEAIPDDSGMGGGKIWKIPAWLRQWAKEIEATTPSFVAGSDVEFQEK